MKLVMALVGLFPDERMVVTLLVVVLLGLVAVLITHGCISETESTGVPRAGLHGQR
jgi:hypothetical protein